jgi:PAS domain S-box-containing protein
MSATNERDVILDSINEGVFTVNLDWRITSFNQAAERITGVPREESIGRFARRCFMPTSAKMIAR